MEVFLAILKGAVYGISGGYMLWRIMDHYFGKLIFKYHIKKLGMFARQMKKINEETGNV